MVDKPRNFQFVARIVVDFRYAVVLDALDAAMRFLDSVDESIEALCKMPQIGAPKALKNPLLTGLRFSPVQDFDNILIFYVVQQDTLRVVRILHGRRDLMKILEREQ